jgi:uncharacterized protein YndB with AHSA1/START domain
MLAKTLLFVASCSAALTAAEAPPPEATPPVGAAPCIACRAPISDPTALHSSADWVALQDGVVLRQALSRESADNDLTGATRAESLIRRPPANVWAVLTDFEHFPEWMPLIRGTRVERRVGARLWVEQRYRILLVQLSHTSIYELDPGDGRLSWRLDEEQPHDIAASQGEWELVSVSAGRETLVRYDARMSAGRAVPEFVERMLRERSLEQMLAGLRTEVLRRYPEN